jgi:hypothetical protein
MLLGNQAKNDKKETALFLTLSIFSNLERSAFQIDLKPNFPV